MKKYIILSPVQGRGSGFIKIEDNRVHANLNLPMGEYAVNLIKSPLLSHTLAAGKMGSTNIVKTIKPGEMKFPLCEVFGAEVVQGITAVLRGVCKREHIPGAERRWRRVTLGDNLPEPAKYILSHPHARFLAEKGHEIYIKQKPEMCLAIRAEFGRHPHPMLLAGHAAVYRNGFFVVAADSKGEYLIYEGVDLPG